MSQHPTRGRGSWGNPDNRFELLRYERGPDDSVEEFASPGTQFYRDSSRSIITYNDSPDVGFDASVNPYRGCEHGCSYCYARPTHEYLGFSSGLDFETRIMVKEDAAGLLRRELMAPGWRPQPLALSGVTDAYQPIERRLQLTRGCLRVLADFCNPVVVITKNRLVTRDSDLLGELARNDAATVFLSVTTLDGRLAGQLEPRAAQPAGRLAAIAELASEGIPVGVLVAPVIPGLTDHEIPAILDAARQAGAKFAGYVILRLPFAVKSIFESWLEQHVPEKKDKVLSRIRELRGGRLNDSRFRSRMLGEGAIAEAVVNMFTLARRKAGFRGRWPALSVDHFRRPGETPPLLFEDAVD